MSEHTPLPELHAFRWGPLLRSREAGLLLLLILTLAGVALANVSFLAPANLAGMLSDCSRCIIIGCGVALVVIAGEIDISVGSMYGFLAALMGLLVSPTHLGLSTPATIVLILAAGLLLGLLNGVLVAVAKIPSIIVTLGMLTILRGATEILLAGAWITDLPSSLRVIGTRQPLGLSWGVWIAAAVFVLAVWITQRTSFGRRLYAVGNSADAARLAGINTTGVKILAFTVTGLLTAVATVVTVPELSVIESGLGVGLELLAVTAVVVGGVSIRGGVGNITGVLLAALLLGIVRTVLVFLKLGSAATFWERAVHGVFILGAVVIDHLASTRGKRRTHGSLEGLHRSTEPISRDARVPLWGILAAGLVALMIGAGISRPDFVSLETQLSLLPQVGELALLAVPMTLIMLIGGIDLSVGAIMALAAVCVGASHQAGAPLWVSGAVGMLVGAACGVFNGAFVVLARLHPLIVTLATLSLFRGLAEGISEGRPVSGFPDSLVRLASERVLGVPVILFPVALAFTVAGLVLWRGVAGRNIRAMGFNETACRFAGIATDRLKLTLYTLSGASAGLAALMLIARRNTAKADAGMSIELDVITAVVLGGTSVAGGRGSIIGTLVGVLLLHELRQFIAWRWYDDQLVLPVIGLVLILSVLAGRAWRGR